MMQRVDPIAFDAYERILALPDPPDLPRRGHVLRLEGKPNRRSTLFPGILKIWLQNHYLSVDGENGE